MIPSLLDIRHEIANALPGANGEVIDALASLAQAGMEEKDEGTWSTPHNLLLAHPIRVAALYINHIWGRAEE